MKTLSYIKTNFLQFILLILLCVILLQRGFEKPETAQPTVTVTRDSVWVFHDSTIRIKPTLVQSTPASGTHWDTVYLPDTSYQGLLKQYKDVAKTLLTTNSYADTLQVDSIGYVYLTDQVSKNAITSRTFSYSLKYPFVKQTVTIREPYKPTRQLYFGGGLEGSNLSLINQVKTGLLYKDRKDRIYLINVGADKNLSLSYGVQTFWKLKF